MRNLDQQQNKFEIDVTTQSNFMTENPDTTASNLPGERYIPYHFKGLTPAQKEKIDAERQQQVRDNKLKKQNEQDEEKMWALQQEANRMIMHQNEQELRQKQNNMMAQTKA